MSDFFIWIWILFTIFIGAEMINLLFKEKPMSKSDAGYASELHEAVQLFISQPLNNPLTRGQIMEIARIALPILEQQERGEGEWIEWGGGSFSPVPNRDFIEVKNLKGTTKGYAGGFRWRKVGNDFDIIAYRIIPEQLTNQNGGES